MSNFSAVENFILSNILNSNGNLDINDRRSLWQLAGDFEILFEQMQSGDYGDTVQFEGHEPKTFDEFLEQIAPELLDGTWQNNSWFNFSGIGRGLGTAISTGAATLNTLWNGSRATARRGASNTNRTRTNDDSNNNTAVNNDGLTRIRTLKNEAATENTDNTGVQEQNAQPAAGQTEADPLEGKTPEEKKTILEQTIQTQRENINSIQNGSNEAVQRAEQRLQSAETAMNQAIDRDKNINDEVKAQIKESETAITAKSQEVSAKEAEIAATDASITQTQNTISNLQNALNSLPSPSGKEEDKEKDAKLAARKTELQNQISAKQNELTQLQAQKQQQEGEKQQLETEKGQLETQKDQIMAEELKDASPATKAAIKAYETSRTNVENTKSNELQKAQEDLNTTMQKLSEVEAEIEQDKNASANTNFDINGIIDAFAQGQIGDCWFLSGLKALSNTEEGRKMLQDAVQINDDGSYTVKFDGVDWAGTFTDADLRAARNSGQYSDGDDDVLLLEIAAQTFLQQARNGQVNLSQQSSQVLSNTIQLGDNPLDTGTAAASLHLFTGATQWHVGSTVNSGAGYDSSLDEFLNTVEANGDNTYATLSFRAGGNTEINTLNAGTVATGANATGSHLWSVKSVSGNTVTLVNPWDSDEEIVTTRDELRRNNVEFVYEELAA